MYRKFTSIWTKYLDPKFKDPYILQKDEIAYQLECLIAQTTSRILEQYPECTYKKAKEGGLNLVMEMMLKIQYENAPQSQKAMLTNLCIEHPALDDLRLEVYEKILEKTTLKYKIHHFLNKLLKK